MGLWDKLFGHRRAAHGPLLRPESVRSVLLMADEGTPDPSGDAVELVLRVYHAANRAMYAALLERDLWPGVQLGYGTFARPERTDPARLAALVRKSHGAEVTAFVQSVTHPLAPGAAPSPLTLVTVHALPQGAEPPPELHPANAPIEPLLDLTSPLDGRDR